MDENKELWNRSVAFHGHSCPGLTIGYKAVLYAVSLLGLELFDGAQTVCVAENDTCSVDAVRVLLGCTAENGNLILDLRDRQVFRFRNLRTGNGVCLTQKAFAPKGGTKADSLAFYQGLAPEELFDAQPADPEAFPSGH